MIVSEELEKLLANSNRENLLLAEAIGWLHDYEKCSDEHLRKYSANLSGQQGLSRSELTRQCPALIGVVVQLIGETCNFVKLLHREPETTCSLLRQYLGRCHRTAHFDKQEPDGGEQNYPGVQISSPFGYERAVPNHLTGQLWGNVPWVTIASHSHNDRANLKHQVRELFAQVGGDTRRPINEVSLWSWGVLVGALYKAALAGAVIGHRPSSNHLRWRLLSVRVNGLDYMHRVARLSDLLARKDLLENGFDKVGKLLEETYALGNEIYRDENGRVYVVADLPNLLTLTNGNGSTLRELILETFHRGTLKDDAQLQIQGEIAPVIELESRAWWGQDPDWKTKKALGQIPQDELPDITSISSQIEANDSNIRVIQDSWKDRVANICVVCGLRPEGPAQKSVDRKTCDVCEQRRADRSLEWAANLSSTIWVDEVADFNGRVALVASHFAIDDWLKPEGLIRTLLLEAPAGATQGVSKNHSLARLQRVWETTATFWDEIKALLSKPNQPTQPIEPVSPRLKIEADFYPQETGDTLGVSHSYELKIENLRLSIICLKEREFLTAENLLRFARQINAPEEYQNNYSTAAMYIRDRLSGRVFEIEEPTGYGSSNKQRGRIAITEMSAEATPYIPAIPILAEPRNFMVLVPANKALEVVDAVKKKYEDEMGKVRNRLPLMVGVVYAGSRTPLAALLDSGRRMLAFKTAEQQWKVSEVKDEEQHRTLTFEVRDGVTNPELRSKIVWRVRTVMGDGVTTDQWYPYFFTDAAPGDYPRMFQSPDRTRQLVHIGDLKGDQNGNEEVYVQPSFFDFEFLDSAAQRFEITYKDGKRRGKERPARPYYLEEIEDFKKLWKMLSEGLSTSQIKQVNELIEAKRGEWFKALETANGEPSRIFAQFVEDALNNAGWKKGKRPKDNEEFDYLVQAALRGQLADVIEMYMQILKLKSTVDGKDSK